jgi:hypothetical protein
MLLAGERPVPESALRLTVFICTIVWLLVPLVNVDLYRAFDLSKLVLFPVTYRTFVAVLLLNGLFDYSAVLFIPFVLFVSIIFASGSAQGLLLALLLVVYIAVLIPVSQTVVLIISKLSGSRRFTDIAFILTFVVIFSMNGINVALNSPAYHGQIWAFLSRLSWLHWVVDATGPGLLSRFFYGVVHSDPPQAAWSFAAFVVEGTLLLWWVSVIVRKFFLGEEIVGAPVRVRRRPPVARRETAEPVMRLLDPVTRAFLGKEMAYLWREPFFKMQLLATLLSFVYLGALVLIFGKPGSVPGAESYSVAIKSWGLVALGYFLATSESRLLFNKFGFEGAGVESLFLMPVERVRILSAKTLFYIVTFQGLNLAFLLVAATVLKAQAAFILLAVAVNVCGVFIVDSVGNVMSVLFPYRIIRRAGRRYAHVFEGQGCLYWIAFSLAIMGSNFIVAPAALFLILPVAFSAPTALAATVPLAAAYVAAVVILSRRWVASLLERREPIIIEFLTKTDGI